MLRTTLLLALAACGTARIIQMTPTGGIIELQGDHSKAMEQATNTMNQKCGRSSFIIDKDGEEPVSADPITTENQQDQSRSGGVATGPDPDAARPATAWRIHFRCGDVASP